MEINAPRQDHGLLVKNRGLRISWAWLFPVMAVAAVGIMYYNQWRSEGPEVFVEFSSAPGIKADKSLLFYRGVEAGIVTEVRLSKSLDRAVVGIRLHKHAKDLAREGTLFWIDQPVFNLAKPSGIESLIEGNSIQARKGEGPPAYYFVGSDEIPLAPLEGDPLVLRLTADSIPFVETGAEVSYHGLPVGLVRKKALDDFGKPYLDVVVAKRYADLIHCNARFWALPPWSLRMGSGVFQLDVASLKNFLLGGIAVDYFGPKGDPVRGGASFAIHPDEASAMAVSEPVTIEFKNAQGLVPGMSQLRYLGLPVGVVDKVVPGNGRILVTARFRQGYEMLRRRGSIFAIVRPQVDFPKISGLETVISGIYIDCVPSPGGEFVSRFRGTGMEDADLIDYEQGGFEVYLNAPATKISAGTSVLYRGVRVGKITRKTLMKGGTGVQLTASIRNEYASLLRENTRFWNTGGVKISGGLINLNVQSSAFESKGLSGVEFSTPSGDAAGNPVKEGYQYDLYSTPKKEWLNWNP